MGYCGCRKRAASPPTNCLAMSETKRKVGIGMLGDVRQYEFDSAFGVLSKILNNIVQSPDEAKYRRLRTTNAKIESLLATSGVRALLVGCGFVEEGESLVLPESASVENVAAGLLALQEMNTARAESENAQKQADLSARRNKLDEEAEKRKVLKAQISDDANARKEPGWKAKAAGVKDGRSITTASDIGACGGGG